MTLQKWCIVQPELETVRRYIYEKERVGTKPDEIVENLYGQELVAFYTVDDFEDFQTLRGEYERRFGEENYRNNRGQRYRSGYSEEFGKHSLKDTENRNLSEGQQKYFAKSKVRDEDGNLRVVYHGSAENFTVFDRTKGRG